MVGGGAEGQVSTVWDVNGRNKEAVPDQACASFLSPLSVGWACLGEAPFSVWCRWAAPQGGHP